MALFATTKNSGNGKGDPKASLSVKQAMGLFYHMSDKKTNLAEYKPVIGEDETILTIQGKKVAISRTNPFKSIMDSKLTSGDYSAWREKHPYVAKVKSGSTF